MASKQLDYVGRRPCGCVVNWVSADMPDDIIAEQVLKFKTRGLIVERMSTAASRQAIVSRCTCQTQDG